MSNKSPISSKNDQVIKRILDKLAEAEKPLPHSLEFYRRILTIQSKTKTPDLSKTTAALKIKAVNRLNQCKPALTFTDIAFDWKIIQKSLRDLTELSIEYLSPEPGELEELTKLNHDLPLLKKTARTWFGIRTISRKSTTKNDHFNPLTASVLQAVFYPTLSNYASELMPLVQQDFWSRNYCPVCGGSPDFSFLDKERGSRWLLCNRCDGQWIFHRLVCPFCNNDDRNSLAYFTNDTGLYRLYVCDKCHRYIKTVDLRKTESDILLPMERILTLEMDKQAYDSNYKAE